MLTMVTSMPTRSRLQQQIAKIAQGEAARELVVVIQRL
jgi:hypothetical protein